MKSCMNKIDSMLEKLSNLVDTRDEKFSDRSDRWQEGEKGDAWEDKTSELHDILSLLEEVQSNISDWLED